MPMIPNLKFHDGREMPQFGLGIWQVPADTTAEVVKDALDLGYRMIDGAAAYRNEEGLGTGIRQSGLDRDELFVTTKVWNHGKGYDETRQSVAESLSRTTLDRFDLILLHWPFQDTESYVAAWKGLIDAQAKGQVTSIGVSNFHEAHLDRLIQETGVIPVLNQIEVNPKLQQSEMRKVNAAREIVTQSWSPLGSGRSFDEEIVQQIAERVGKSAPQVILRWHIQLNNAVISRSENKQHLAANMDIFDFELSKSEMDAMSQLQTGERTGPDPETFDGK